MTYLEEVLWKAWKVVGPKLLGDPAEVRRRLGRRELPSYRRPMRAECLAVRASDTRLNAVTAAMVPDDAAYPGRQDLWREHEVYLDTRLLRTLCVPVAMDWQEEVPDLAKRLGCHPVGLRYLRRNGTLSVQYIKGLGGKRRNVPLVYTGEMLDPTAKGKRRPDLILGGSWAHRAGGLRDDFEQVVRRAPEWRYRCQRKLHVGWRWLCPRCGRRVSTILYPVRMPDWAEYLVACGAVTEEEARRLGVGECGLRDADCGSMELPAFACGRCHWPWSFCRGALSHSWNMLVLHSTGGLLYGKEVKRPAWLVPERRMRPRKLSRPTPAPRREELTRLLVGTKLSLREIAAEMGLKRATVQPWSSLIYRRHGVHSREALRRARPELMVAGRKMAG